jgi:carbonic anhydrase
MSMIDKALKANEEYVRKYDPRLGGHPHPKVAVVTCMDPRLSDLEGILGLNNADLDVIRTGGPVSRTMFWESLSFPPGCLARGRSCSSIIRAVASRPLRTRS